MKENKILWLTFILVGFFAIQKTPVALASTPITSAGVNGTGGFPVALTSASTTYQLTENINCATTCFTVKASNVTLDLNGFTATFGTANNPGMFNTGMESWTDVNTLANWTIINGTVTRRAAQVWGTYDAELSSTASIKSDPITLNAGQTYSYYSIIKGSTADSYSINVRRVSDDVILASETIDSYILNRAFAMGDGSMGAAEHNYKPSVDTEVYLQIDCTGGSTKLMHVADIKPRSHFFLASNNYRTASLYPDLADGLFGAFPTGLVIQNGTITQGAGQAVKSAAIYSDAILNINHLNINMSGNNTTTLRVAGTFIIDTVNTDTASILNFNRMHPTVGLAVIHGGGVSEIKNCSFLNDPEQTISELNSWATGNETGSLKIHDNVIRGKQQVTEGYAIVLSGGNVNVEIYNNDINPFQGRGILLDSVANRSGYIDSSKNVSIHNNTIRNIHEVITPEYDATMLEAAGIRVRDWGGTNPAEGHRNLKIYENNISVFADSTGTHRSYGINITSSAALTTAEIYDNTISASLLSSGGSDWEASCIALQGADMSGGGSIKIRNNVCTGNIGFRLGGNDGFSAKNIDIYNNNISTNKANINYYSYQGPFTNNRMYCNKMNNTSATGHIVYFENVTTPVITTQWFSNNLITNSNSGGFEIFTNINHSGNVTFCGSGTVDVTGGGSVGSASAPCHDGFTGCYSTAGLSSVAAYTISDFTALISSWLHAGIGNASDFNHDSVVNAKDLAIMMSKWQ